MYDSTSTTALNPLDLESRVGPNDHQNLRLWLRLLSCSNFIENEIRSRLRTEFQTTPPRFDLMAQLHSSRGGLSMSELSKRMMVTNGNITGITDQLEKDGIVERIQLASDRRSSLIRLTTKGRRYYKRIANAHDVWINTLFTSLPEATHRSLLKHLNELKQVTRVFSSNSTEAH